MRKIAGLLLDGSIVFDIGTVLTVFLPRPDSPRPQLPFELTLCSEAGRPVRTGQDIDVSVNAGLEALADADLIIVPGCAPAMVPGQDAPVDEGLRVDVAAGQLRPAMLRVGRVVVERRVVAAARSDDVEPVP